MTVQEALKLVTEPLKELQAAANKYTRHVTHSRTCIPADDCVSSLVKAFLDLEGISGQAHLKPSPRTSQGFFANAKKRMKYSWYEHLSSDVLEDLSS